MSYKEAVCPPRRSASTRDDDRGEGPIHSRSQDSVFMQTPALFDARDPPAVDEQSQSHDDIVQSREVVPQDHSVAFSANSPRDIPSSLSAPGLSHTDQDHGETRMTSFEDGPTEAEHVTQDGVMDHNRSLISRNFAPLYCAPTRTALIEEEHQHTGLSEHSSMDPEEPGDTVCEDSSDSYSDAEASRPQDNLPKPINKKNLKRHRLSHSETRFLLNQFGQNPHPDAAQRAWLAKQVNGLSARQIQVWFQNRRAKLKRMSASDADRMLSTRSYPEGYGPQGFDGHISKNNGEHDSPNICSDEIPLGCYQDMHSTRMLIGAGRNQPSPYYDNSSSPSLNLTSSHIRQKSSRSSHPLAHPSEFSPVPHGSQRLQLPVTPALRGANHVPNYGAAYTVPIQARSSSVSAGAQHRYQAQSIAHAPRIVPESPAMLYHHPGMQEHGQRVVPQHLAYKHPHLPDHIILEPYIAPGIDYGQRAYHPAEHSSHRHPTMLPGDEHYFHYNDGARDAILIYHDNANHDARSTLGHIDASSVDSRGVHEQRSAIVSQGHSNHPLPRESRSIYGSQEYFKQEQDEIEYAEHVYALDGRNNAQPTSQDESQPEYHTPQQKYENQRAEYNCTAKLQFAADSPISASSNN